jgi:hypothetical protein
VFVAWCWLSSLRVVPVWILTVKKIVELFRAFEMSYLLKGLVIFRIIQTCCTIFKVVIT